MKKHEQKSPKQVFYQGRWVDKETFRAFVYNDKEQKLANSYSEYEAFIATGIWFSEKPSSSKEAPTKVERVRKLKHDANS